MLSENFGPLWCIKNSREAQSMGAGAVHIMTDQYKVRLEPEVRHNLQKPVPSDIFIAARAHLLQVLVSKIIVTQMENKISSM